MSELCQRSAASSVGQSNALAKHPSQDTDCSWKVALATAWRYSACVAGEGHNIEHTTARQEEETAGRLSRSAPADPSGQHLLGSGHGHGHALPGSCPVPVCLAVHSLHCGICPALQHGEPCRIPALFQMLVLRYKCNHSSPLPFAASISWSEPATTVMLCFESRSGSRILSFWCSGCCCQPFLEPGWSLACCSAQRQW